MNKHTPGPWLIIGNSFVYALSERKSRAVNRMNLQVDAGWNGEVRTSDEEVLANARLIAAAPELLEALDKLLADYVYADGEGVIDVSGADSAEKARAAIAKARGETK